MSNEFKTIFGAIGTAATAIAAGLTFGQVEELNDAVVSAAKFTEEKAKKTIVRHVGETAINAVETVGTAVVAGVCMGQVDSLNNAVVESAKSTAKSAEKTAVVVAEDAEVVVNATPGVGHVKGTVHYLCGDKEGGDKAMKSASRTTGAVVGGIVGIAGGPVGMVLGGMGGAASVDGATTGVESAIKKKYTPSGYIDAGTRIVKAVKADDDQELIEGVADVCGLAICDGSVGLAVGETFEAGGEGMGSVALARNHDEMHYFTGPSV